MKPPKPKLCPECRSEFTPTKPLQKYCSPVCFWEAGKKKIALKQKKDWKAEKKVLKEKVKTLADWKAELQKEINTIVRLIDFGSGCIATGATKGKMNAGHFYGTLASPHLRYHLHNIFLQSEHSNVYKSGDTIRYQDGLKKIYGQEYFEYVESLRKTPPIKLTIETLKDKIIIARLIVRELKELGNTYSPKERIELRNNLNLRLGIYL